MQGSLRSAGVIVPLVLELTGAKSVADIGCGVGTWLSVYKKHGISDLLGLDGDYVDRSMLLVPEHEFIPHDLTRPFGLDRKYDLVQSLEVAEHLGQQHAENFVRELVQLGQMVLFSAAVPYQLGTGHVNEQFADYWIDIFSGFGYRPIDPVRPAVWNNEQVEVCYRQNILLFVSETAAGKNTAIRTALDDTNPGCLSMIHPELYIPRIKRLLITLFENARTVQSNGNFPLARKIYTSILDFDPGFAQAWHALGQLDIQTNDVENGIVHIQRAIELKPGEANFIFTLGQIHAAMGNASQAREHFTRALEILPGDPNILAALQKLA